MYLSIRPDGYALRLTPMDLERWATRPGSAWPCSGLIGGGPLYVEADDSGLVDISGPSKADPRAVEACIGDHLPPPVRHLWPCWEVLRPHDPH